MVMRAMGAAGIVLYLCSFVTSPHQLLFLRLMHGAFSGFVSSAIALIATDVPEGKLGFSLGIYQGTIMGGLIIGPFVGGILQDHLGIRPTLEWGSGLIMLGLFLVLVLVREKKSEIENKKNHSIWENATFLFKNRTLWPAVRIAFLSNMAMMSIPPILALLVIDLAGNSVRSVGTLSGMAFSATALSIMFAGPVWGRLADKWGQKKVLTICLFMSGVMFIPQALAQTVWQLIAGRFLLGLFMAGIAPSVQSLVANHTPHERRAGILGVSFSFNMMGNAVGPLVGGVLAASFGLRIPFFAAFLLLVFASVLSQKIRIKLTKGKATPVTETI